MPIPVALAGLLQLALAGMFVVMLAAYRTAGPRAQRAAEAETARQDADPEVLGEHGVRLEEGRWGFVAGYAIAAVLTVLAALNLAGSEIGRISTWVVQPLVLLGVGYVTTIQVFAIPMIASAFAKLDDPRARSLDVRAVLRAAVAALPSWYRPATVLRWLLATVGSLVVIVALTLPAAGSYYS
ncbi:hypothetical protein [Nocardia cyriacigeorgica]|uniref:Uncharacterized protein n=1 Tax=Nocardia cyriacigeorgica TaxID=135487 RepID=A0A6P1D7Z3_9NOCA|nr:hypothetical protein [Nocardia cyriacigeorgica]NEW45641.1 hypothetical protein [Nocardia cyriacigeorgica]